MSLPLDLQKLPPQALDVIRYLRTLEQGADVVDIMAGTGLSERALGKAIRRLVTRYYVEMPAPGYYTLTKSGRQAAQDIGVYDGSTPEMQAAPSTMTTAAAEEIPAPIVTRHMRRLSVWVAQELVVRSGAVLMAGFDAPAAAELRLTEPGRIIVRLNAPGCDVEPVERPLEVIDNKPAGPLRFRLTPRREGTLRIKIEVHQLITLQQREVIGGMYFDINVASFPTPQSVEFQALGAMVGLHVSG